MLLTSISYRRSKGEPERSWRFASSQGSGRQVAAIMDGDESLLRDLARAIDALAAPPGNSVASVGMVLIDDDGNTWTLERSPQRTVLMKNSVTVPVPTGSPLLTLVHDAGGTLGRFQPIQILTRGNELTARGVAQIASSVGVSEQLQERVHTLCNRAAVTIEQPLLRNPEILLALAERTGMLWSQMRECHVLAERLQQEAPDETNSITIKRLGEQIVVLDQIERLATPLLASREAGRSLKEGLEQTENSIRQLLDAHRLTEDQATSLRNLPWSELIARAAEVERLENLVKFGEQCQQLASSQVRPVVEEHLKKLEDQFNSQGQLAAELNQYIEVALSDESARQGLVGRLIARGKKLIPRRQESPATNHLPVTVNHLTKSQAAAQEAIACIHEIHPKLSDIRSRFENGVERVFESHEKLIRDLGSSRKALRRAVEQAGLPPTSDLTAITGLAQTETTLTRLLSDRDELITKIQSRREQLIKLQKAIMQWRHVSGSQKQSDLKSASILLNEAHTLLQTREEKIRQFQKLAEQQEAQTSRSVGMEMVNHRLNELRDQWQQAFGELGMEAVDWNDGRWRDVLRAAQEVKALMSILSSHGLDEEQSLEAVLSQKGLLQQGIMPVLMLRPHPAMATSNRISDLLCHASHNIGICLVLTSDQAMMSKLASEGAAIAHLTQTRPAGATMVDDRPNKHEGNSSAHDRATVRQTEKTQTANTPTTSAGATKAPTSLLSPRARAALEVLSGAKNKVR